MNDIQPSSSPSARPGRGPARSKTASTGRSPRRRTSAVATSPTATCYQHLVLGWWWLAAFLLLGTLLEAMHGFKWGWYLDVGHELRRTQLSIAHASGAIAGVLHLLFAGYVRSAPSWTPATRLLSSKLLVAATVFIPAGLLLDAVFRPSTAGRGVILVAVGGCLLALSLLQAARAAR